MSHYNTRWCETHGEYEADVDGDGYCEECTKLGQNSWQLLEKRAIDAETALTALREQVEQLRILNDGHQRLATKYRERADIARLKTILIRAAAECEMNGRNSLANEIELFVIPTVTSLLAEVERVRQAVADERGAKR